MDLVPAVYRAVAAVSLGFAAIHLTAGVAFAVAFQVRGLASVDPTLRRAGLGLRLVLLPGVILLWPWLAVLWRRAATGGDLLPPAGPSPERLRWLHRRAWWALLIAGPLILGVALGVRRPPPPPQPWPPSALR